MPVKTNREYRKFEGFELRKDENGRMVVEGYATTFNQPYRLMGDDKITIKEQVDRHAFDETDMSDVIMQYDHEGRVFARISNGTLELKEDDHGLRISADLSGTDIGRQLYQEIEGGYTNKMSFGFKVADEKRTRTKDDNGHITVLRTITKIGKLYDVSAVSLPANDATEISARSIGDGLITEALEEVKAEEERERKEKQIGEIRKLLNMEDTDHENV